MKKQKASGIKLVITIALKKEMPKDLLSSQHVPVHTVAALKSGAIAQDDNAGMLVVITGSGNKASEEAACWIRDNLAPLFVVNIGTCGIVSRKLPLCEWIRPQYVANEEGECLELDTRLPVHSPENARDVHSLISVKKASPGNIPDIWRKHDVIDMECYWQAKIFRDAGISFHCLKFGTDHSDKSTFTDFNRNVELFAQETEKLFSFVETGKNNPQVTVVIPVYNRRQTIRRAIDSVLAQSHPPEEVIVVDDCSTDETKEIVESYRDKLTLISLPENSGPSRARNEGTKHAGTEWISFLDSDDCWEKDKLRDQLEYLRRYPFYEILQSEELWIRNGVRVNPCNHHAKPEGWIWEQSLERCLISPSGVLLKKTLLEKYGGFDEGMPVCEDYDLWLRISRHHPVGLEPGFSVIKYGGHEEQLSRKYPAMDRFRVKALLKLLKEETGPDFRKKISLVLKKKLSILMKGYEKRNKFEDAKECKDILEMICLP